ncbi:flagellar biosynthesis protein FlhF [Derxia gummosa]|uniref:Flagellar biosynthesis protein FlhF n=1 Tax=Derxia gummosa DSM 723 TaxID=1121388 RepID=A0A8B6X6E3_9BURK|nr:flagellar biosynthesis protein FlhF [Derxia gummosa]
MSLRKFFGATSREALMEARREIGDDAVVISTRRTGSGVEVVAASEAELSQLTAGKGAARGAAPAAPQRAAAPAAPQRAAAPQRPATASAPRAGGQPRPAVPVDEDEALPSIIRNPRAAPRAPFAERVRQTEPRASAPKQGAPVPFLDYLRRPGGEADPTATQPALAATRANLAATQAGLAQTRGDLGQTQRNLTHTSAHAPMPPQPARHAAPAAPAMPAAAARRAPEPARHEPVHHEPPRHESARHDAMRHEPVRREPMRAEPVPLRHAEPPTVTQPALPRRPLHGEMRDGQPSPLAPAFLRRPPEPVARSQPEPLYDDLPDLHADGPISSAAALQAAAPDLSLPAGSALPVPDLSAIDLADALRDKLSASLREELGADLKRELQNHLRAELRNEFDSIRGWMTSQFDTIAFNERQRRRPVAASMQKMLLADGFSPLLARDLAARLPEQLVDEAQARGWARAVLERNLHVMGMAHDLVDSGGIYALVGPTGVGKTTTVAKLAARCAAKYGRDAVGLVTIDSYRIGAQDQLRIYGKILGVTVHTAQDRESLLGVLRGLTGKKLVLIDTLGLGQRDERVAELLSAVGAGAIKRLLVLNAAAHAETLEDVVAHYRVAGATAANGKTVADFAGAVLTKTDEAVRLGQALDVLIRHRLPLYYETTGQRVPEDITPASAGSLVMRALAHAPARPFRVNDDEVGMTYVDRGPDMLAGPAGPAHA